MVGLEAILRAVHVAFQLRIAQVAKRVDAADELVELEDRAPRRVRRGVGAQLADQRALRHFLQPECGDDPVDVRLLAMDEIAVDFPGLAESGTPDTVLDRQRSRVLSIAR